MKSLLRENCSLSMKAKRNTHCARRRTCSDIQKLAKGENHLLSAESLGQNNFKDILKDCEVSNAVQRSSNHRRTVVAFFSLESNGDLKVVAVPVQYSGLTNHTESGYRENVDGPHLVSPSPVSSLRSAPCKAQNGPATNGSCFDTPLTDESFSGPNIQPHPQNKDLNNKEVRSIKRRKKAKKKGKRNKRLSGKTGTSGLECTLGCSTSGTDANKASDDGPNSNVSSETTSDSLVLDSVSLGSKSDESSNADRESAGIDFSQSPGDLINGESSSGNMPNDVIYFNNHSDSAHCVREECTNGDEQSEVLEKREKQIKNVRNNYNVHRNSSVGNLNDRFGKGNSLSVWQKVQRNDADECNYESKTVDLISSHFDNESKESPLLKKHQNVVDSTTLSNSEDSNQTKPKNSENMKRKTDLRSRKENNYLGKGSHAIKTHSNLCNSNNAPRNELMDSPSRFSRHEESNSGSRSYSKIDCPKIETQTKRVESAALKPCLSSQVFPNELEPFESTHTTVFSLNDRNAKSQTSSSFQSSNSNSIEPSEKCEKLCRVQLHTCVDNEGAKVEKNPFADHIYQDTSSGPTMQKWIPIGVKDDGLPRFSGTSNLSMVNLHEPKSKDQDVHVSSIELSKIVCAINEVHRAQWASEAIEMTTGCPIAAFERFLRSASPVICPSYNILSCQTCSRDQVIGASLCRHETPNISLRNLWEWYEKHGSYGLEVKVEDHENSKRFNDSVAFRAYFVPLLSAVQLFRKRKDHYTDNTSEKSSVNDNLPITSALIPPPLTEESSYLVPRDHTGYSERSSVCIKENESIQPVDRKYSDDLELLFEYFESERPQNRRPLFEMIKELIKGDGPSQCRSYGDPNILESVGVHDLHPKSWYSVAWYPIYKIPDGNFRAAFLTYHSLGHLVRRGSSTRGKASIVSPVVGLQSYSAQSEGWFQLRNSPHIQTAEVSNLNPSGILKERLRTLEQTASVIARDVVTKGGQTYTNKHPDYEFFLSRRR